MILRMSNQTARKTSPPCAIAAIAEARFRANSRTAFRGISCNALRSQSCDVQFLFRLSLVVP